MSYRVALRAAEKTSMFTAGSAVFFALPWSIVGGDRSCNIVRRLHPSFGESFVQQQKTATARSVDVEEIVPANYYRMSRVYKNKQKSKSVDTTWREPSDSTTTVTPSSSQDGEHRDG